MEKNKMRTNESKDLVKTTRIELEQAIKSSIVEELLELTEADDLEFLETFEIELNKDINKFDFLYQVYFKSFNKQFDIELFRKRIEKLNDTEIAFFEASEIKDIIVVYIYL
jgi:uncharacterized protein YbcI